MGPVGSTGRQIFSIEDQIHTTLDWFTAKIISSDISTGMFLKYKDGHFVWPELDDEDTISTDNVVKVLPVPELDRRGNTLTLEENFDEYNIR